MNVMSSQSRTGNSRQETGGRKHETGDGENHNRRQKTGNRKQKTGDRRHRTGDKDMKLSVLNLSKVMKALHFRKSPSDILDHLEHSRVFVMTLRWSLNDPGLILGLFLVVFTMLAKVVPSHRPSACTIRQTIKQYYKRPLQYVLM